MLTKESNLMHITHKKITPNTLHLKIAALILGYCLWSLLSQSHITTMEYTIPLLFYNIPPQTTIDAPEYLNIQLQGNKMALSLLKKSLAAHIDTQTLKKGTN